MRPLLILISSSLVLTTEATFSQPQTPDIPQPGARPDTTTLLVKDSSATVVGTAHKAGDWERMLARQMNEIRQLYSDFFIMREIESTQANTLVHLLALERLLTSSWSSDRISHTPQAADHARAREAVAQIETMLGGEGYAALNEYRETLRERFHLRKLFQLLDTVGYGLSNEQKVRMVAIMVSERYRLDPALFSAPRGSPEQADEIVALLDAHDDAVHALFGPVLTAEQREFAARHYAKRAERRHSALTRYRKALSEGDTSMGFVYPAD